MLSACNLNTSNMKKSNCSRCLRKSKLHVCLFTYSVFFSLFVCLFVFVFFIFIYIFNFYYYALLSTSFTSLPLIDRDAIEFISVHFFLEKSLSKFTTKVN